MAAGRGTPAGGNSSGQIDLRGIVASGCVEWMRTYSAMSVLLIFYAIWTLPWLHTSLVTCREATETPDTLTNRGSQPAGGSLQNVPEMTYWVLCCICLVYRHGCPLGRTQWGPSIGPASHTLGRREAAIGVRDTPSQRHSPSVCGTARTGYFAPPGSLATRRGVRLRADGQVTAGTR